MPLTFVLNGCKYNKTQALDLCREIANRNKGRLLKGIDLLIMQEVLFIRKKVKSEKIKVGKDWSKRYNSFFFLNFQEEWEDFSFKKAFDTNIQIDKQDILGAFRFEIWKQVKIFRNENLDKYPKLKKLAQKDPFSVHTDHIIPVHVLVSDFLKDNELKLSDILIEEDNSISFPTNRLQDRVLAQRWDDYHKKHAKFQLMTAQENLSKGGREDKYLYLYRLKRGETYDT